MRLGAYKDSYRDRVRESLSVVGADSDLVLEVKAELFAELLEKHLGPARRQRVLDVGCGPGLMDRLLERRVGALHASDLERALVERAASANPATRYVLGDGTALPYRDGAFDAALAVCVLHHVPPARWSSFLAEVGRVVRQGGLVVVFEHNPLNPVTRAVVRRCEFDADAVLLGARRARELGREAGLVAVESRSILYFPWRGRAFRAAERALAAVPLGGQYLVAWRR